MKRVFPPFVPRETQSSRPGTRWTRRELKFLGDNRVQWESVAWLAGQLGRSEAAVAAQLRRQRITMQPHRPPALGLRATGKPKYVGGRRRRRDRVVELRAA